MVTAAILDFGMRILDFIPHSPFQNPKSAFRNWQSGSNGKTFHPAA